jgi:hypothetical protein
MAGFTFQALLPNVNAVLIEHALSGVDVAEHPKPSPKEMSMKPTSLFLVAVAASALAVPSVSFASTCAGVWNAGTAYTGGQAASLNTVNYTANWWTQGQSPASNSGGSGSGQPWTSAGACSAGTTPSPTPTPTPTPTPGSTTHLFAPYVDMSLTADQNIVSMQGAAGFKAVTLAFLVSTNGCAVGWGGLGGTLPTDTLANGTTILSQVQALQKAGVQVIVSFGGASGQEPAVNCTSAAQLQALYQSVITRYGVTMLDFDIEGGEQTNDTANALRAQALKGLKAANPKLVVSYTLPVLPTGLTVDGTNILNGVKSAGLALDVLNIMAMDYGGAVASGGMGTDAVDAAQAAEAQLKAAGLTATTVGITPMIGQNDSQGEIFSLSDAQTVLNFASSTTYVSRLSMWSLARDNGGCPGQSYASPSCSGVPQSAYQFVANFGTYGK